MSKPKNSKAKAKAKSTPDTKLVTIITLVSIMGFLQSPANPCLENLTTELKDTILQYFFKYMSYLDDLQTGLVAEEILELQRQMDLDAEDLRSRTVAVMRMRSSLSSMKTC